MFIGYEPRPGEKLDKTVDEIDWSLVFYLIYEVIYLG